MRSPALTGKPNCPRFCAEPAIPLTSKCLFQMVISTWKGLAGSQGRGEEARVQHTQYEKQTVCKGCRPHHPIHNYPPPSHPTSPRDFLSVCTSVFQGLNHLILPGAGAGTWEHTVDDLHKVSYLHRMEILYAVNS